MKEQLLLKIVKYLIKDSNNKIEIPESYQELKKTYKLLVNLRIPKPIDDEVLKLEDKYLNLELKDKRITDVNDLKEIEPNIVLWQGDITTLKCDIIVNAGNNGGLGCFNPSHICIDNTIHTNAGMRLRLECNNILKGNVIKTGDFIICNGYNLHCRKVITTVGPKIGFKITKKDEKDLSNCYKKVLEYAIRNNFNSIAFPCISTGLFGYPISKAKVIAYNSVKAILKKYGTNIKVIFNVYSEADLHEYRELFKN